MGFWEKIKDWWDRATGTENKGTGHKETNKELEKMQNDPAFSSLENTPPEVSPTTKASPPPKEPKEPVGPKD